MRYKIVNVVVFATNAFTLKEEEDEDKEHPPTKRRFVGVLLLVVLFKDDGDDDKRGEDKDTTEETIISFWMNNELEGESDEREEVKRKQVKKTGFLGVKKCE